MDFRNGKIFKFSEDLVILTLVTRHTIVWCSLAIDLYLCNKFRSNQTSYDKTVHEQTYLWTPDQIY